MSSKRRIPNSIFGSGGGVATSAPGSAANSVGGNGYANASSVDRRPQGQAPPPVRELTDEQRQEIKEAVSLEHVDLIECVLTLF